MYIVVFTYTGDFFSGVITIVNCASVKWASRVQVIFTVAKMSAIAMIVLTGIIRIAQGMYSQLLARNKRAITNQKTYNSEVSKKRTHTLSENISLNINPGLFKSWRKLSVNFRRAE